MSVYSSPIRQLRDAPPTCNLWWIRAQLGRTDVSDQRFVKYVQGLVDAEGFPPPFPSQPKGKPITRAVTPLSTWRRDAVEAWLADFLPPAGAEALDAAACAAAADAMDEAAANLGRLRLMQGGRP